MKNFNVKIYNWINHGECLIEGPCDSKEISNFLMQGKCTCEDECSECEGTGRIDDIYIEWENEKNTENVYEFVDY